MSLNNCAVNICDDSELGTYEVSECGVLIPGGSNAIILLTCGSLLTDASNGTQIQAEITAGRAYAFPGISATLDAASAVVITSKLGCTPDSVGTYSRAGTLYSPIVTVQNINIFRTILSGGLWGGLLIKECAANRVTWIDAAISFQGNRILPQTENEEQRIDATFNWKDLYDPRVFAMPTGDFW